MQHRHPHLHIKSAFGEALEARSQLGRRQLLALGRCALGQHGIGHGRRPPMAPLIDVEAAQAVAAGIGSAAQGCGHGVG